MYYLIQIIIINSLFTLYSKVLPKCNQFCNQQMIIMSTIFQPFMTHPQGSPYNYKRKPTSVMYLCSFTNYRIGSIKWDLWIKVTIIYHEHWLIWRMLSSGMWCLACLAYYSTLKGEVLHSSKILVNFYQTICFQTPEDSTVHSHCHGNLKYTQTLPALCFLSRNCEIKISAPKKCLTQTDCTLLFYSFAGSDLWYRTSLTDKPFNEFLSMVVTKFP